MASGTTTTTNISALIKKLQSFLKKTKYIGEFNIENITIGKSEAYVPIYYHIFYKFSKNISTKVSHHSVKLFARNDAKFVQGIFRILKDIFHFVPKITKEQFLQTGFSELKLTTCINILHLVYKVHIDEANLEKPDAHATAGRSMREQPRARKSNAQQLQRQSMQEPSKRLLLDVENKRQHVSLGPKIDPVDEEPADHSTPKEGVTATAGRPRAIYGSLQSLGCNELETPTMSENYPLYNDLQADVKELKRQIVSLTTRLDEMTDYVYSPVNILSVPRPRKASLPDMKL